MADEEFLKRWSREKMTKTQKPEEHEVSLDGNSNQAALPDVPEVESDAAVEAPPPELPDIDTLDADSDYTAFLGENVPEELTRKALRKLWTSDPVFANLDGLNDYDDDYSKIGIVKTVVETAYKVGKGFATEDDEDLVEEEGLADEEPLSEEDTAEIEESNDEPISAIEETKANPSEES